mmetsp:Transcript_102926/g.295104  ORF Transcript_102926/g.295104 Transcript_102926/m.295104 type:complete len:323 (-) Transcript_102926:642-1610(-)
MQRTRVLARFGVAFDVDGVLTRVPNAIPGAYEALSKLQAGGVPFCLMTNGGGATEASKAESLSKLLGLDTPLVPEQICLCHTPMKALAKPGPESLKDETVLLVGKKYGQLKDIAETYGFTRAITVEELHARYPDMYNDMPPAVELDPSSVAAESDLKIKAILTMIDPIEWGRETQIVCDVLRSDGTVGTDVDTQVVAMHNSCSDFEYAARWPTPRFGAGAFRHSLEALWSALSGREMVQTLYGKPHPVRTLAAREPTPIEERRHRQNDHHHRRRRHHKTTTITVAFATVSTTTITRYCCHHHARISRFSTILLRRCCQNYPW